MLFRKIFCKTITLLPNICFDQKQFGAQNLFDQFFFLHCYLVIFILLLVYQVRKQLFLFQEQKLLSANKQEQFGRIGIYEKTNRNRNSVMKIFLFGPTRHNTTYFFGQTSFYTVSSMLSQVTLLLVTSPKFPKPPYILAAYFQDIRYLIL